MNWFSGFNKEKIETAEIMQDEEFDPNSLYQNESPLEQLEKFAREQSSRRSSSTTSYKPPQSRASTWAAMRRKELEMEQINNMQAASHHMEMQMQRAMYKSGYDPSSAKRGISMSSMSGISGSSRGYGSDNLYKLSNILKSKKGVAHVNGYIFDVSKSYMVPKKEIILYVIAQRKDAKFEVVTGFTKLIPLTEISSVDTVAHSTFEKIINESLLRYTGLNNFSSLITFEGNFELVENLYLRYSTAIDGYYSLYTKHDKKDVLDFKDVNDLYNLFKKQVTMEALIKTMKDE